MSKIHFNNTFSSGCVQFMAADWPATTAHKMIYLLTSYTVPYVACQDTLCVIQVGKLYNTIVQQELFL